MLGPPVRESTGDNTAPSLVAGWWCSTVSGTGTVTPDGAVDLLWSSDKGPWLAGPDTQPRTVELRPGVEVVGVRLRPGVAKGLLGDGVNHVADRQVPLSTILSRPAYAKLEDALGSSYSNQQVAEQLTASLSGWLPASWTPDAVVIAAVQGVRSGASPDLGGLSQRQFRRRFRATMGVSPGFYRKLMRLDRLTSLLSAHPHRTISELAAQAGYFDESHLSRDCLALAGVTPGKLRSER